MHLVVGIAQRVLGLLELQHVLLARGSLGQLLGLVVGLLLLAPLGRHHVGGHGLADLAKALDGAGRSHAGLGASDGAHGRAPGLNAAAGADWDLCHHLPPENL